MTDKRFNIVNHSVHDGIGELTVFGCCDELNRLYEENESLKEENEQLQEQRAELFIRERDTKNEWREMKQENESLKEEIKFLRNKVATYKKGNALLKSTMDKEWK